MQKILAILPFINSPENPLEYLNHSSDRRWELTINWKTKVYLTDNERNYFMEALKAGKKIIQIGDLVLTKRFDCLIPLTKPKVQSLTEEEKNNIIERERQRMKKV